MSEHEHHARCEICGEELHVKPRKLHSEPSRQRVFSVKLPLNEDNLDALVPERFGQLRELLEDPERPRSKAYTLASAFDLALIQAKD